jgi:uncharacterized membrane protein YkoI
MSKRILLLIFILTIPPAGIGQDDYELARSLMEEGIVLPLGVIIAKARRDGMAGRVIDVKFHHHLDHYLYHVQVLDETGLIHGVIFDATNGAVLDVHED